MKTGVILYVSEGKNIMDEDFDMIGAVKRLPIMADRVEVISSTTGHFDIMDAWWLLITKGMKKVVCMFAEVTNNSELRLTGKELRLCG